MEMKTSTALKNAIAAMVWALDNGHAISDLEGADNTLYILHKLLFAAEQKEADEG